MKRPYKDNLKHWQQSVQSGLCLTFWVAIFFPGVAHAYVDPGSGSVIVTTILGLIAAIGYTFRSNRSFQDVISCINLAGYPDLTLN